MATPVVQIQTYVGTKELKEAIEHYATDKGKPVWEIIADTWKSMLASGDFTISVDTLYEESVDTGIDRKENQAQRRFKLTMPPDLVEEIDQVITDLKRESHRRWINRSSFTQEAIRRYLEPELITKGYLATSQFKNKRRAAQNLVLYRESLGLTRPEFLAKYYTVEGQLLISYPQYATIERNGKGNVDRLLDIVAESSHIMKEAFYWPTEDFLAYLKRLN